MASQTFDIAASGDDLYVYRDNSVGYPPSTATTVGPTNDAHIYVAREFLTGNDYRIYIGLLRFDTSALPDSATVTAATLRLYIEGGGFAPVGVDSLSVVAEWYTWNGTTSDYSATPGANAHAGTTVSSLPSGGLQNFTLINTATVGNVSLTGYTYLRLNLSQRPSDATPTGRNAISIASFDQALVAVPQLTVTYKTSDNDLIQLGADGAGKKMRTQSVWSLGIDGTHTVHTGYDSVVDESTANAARILNAIPTSTDYAQLIRRETEDSGAVPVSFVATGLSGTATETLASITPVRAFATGTAATTQTVPSGVTMRVSGISGMVTRTTSTGGQQFAVRVNLRVNTSGTATASSPIAASGTTEWTKDATTAVGYGAEPVYVDIPGGLDIPAGASFGITYQVLTTGTVSRSTAELVMHGFQY